jgi:hypothetical protein
MQAKVFIEKITYSVRGQFRVVTKKVWESLLEVNVS